MKNQIVQDERVLAQKRKIQSEICSLLLIIILISMLIKQYFLNLPFVYYVTEFILFWSSILYFLIRNLMLGNNLYPNNLNLKKIITSSIILGFVIAMLIMVLSGQTTFSLLAIIFFVASVVTFIVYFAFYILNKKRQISIYNEMEQEENDIE